MAAIRGNMWERQAGNTASGLYRSSGSIDAEGSGHAEGGAQKPRHARAETPADMSQGSSPCRRSGGYHRSHRRGHRRRRPTLSRPGRPPAAAPRCSSYCAARLVSNPKHHRPVARREKAADSCDAIFKQSRGLGSGDTVPCSMAGVALPDCPKLLSLPESSTGLVCTLTQPQEQGCLAHKRARPFLGTP